VVPAPPPGRVHAELPRPAGAVGGGPAGAAGVAEPPRSPRGGRAGSRPGGGGGHGERGGTRLHARGTGHGSAAWHRGGGRDRRGGRRRRWALAATAHRTRYAWSWVAVDARVGGRGGGEPVPHRYLCDAP